MRRKKREMDNCFKLADKVAELQLQDGERTTAGDCMLP